MKNMERIYLDYAAATPVDPEVKTAMDEFYDQNFGNASGLYKEGREAKKSLGGARANIAKILGARPGEIIFTSGGTESNNLGIFGIANNFAKGHVITSQFEHRSVLEPMKELESRGFKVDYIKVSRDGFVDPGDVKNALQNDTVLVSIMYVNNEIGTIQPIREISKVIKDFNKSIIFHTDACQAANYLDLNIDKLGVDLASFSGAKIYGPKGVGFLYKKEGIGLRPLILGGGQEMGFRSGTESLGQIIGMARAFEMARERKSEELERLGEILFYFADGIKKIAGTEINGSLKNRIPSNLSVSFLGIDSESLIVALDEEGISVSSGSACDLPRLHEVKADSKLAELPHVILSLGKGEGAARGVIRFSFGIHTKKEEITRVLEVLPKLIQKLNINVYERSKAA